MKKSAEAVSLIERGLSLLGEGLAKIQADEEWVDQKHYDLRWALLARAAQHLSAAITFVSYESALGALIPKCNGCGYDARNGASGDNPGAVNETDRGIVRQLKEAS